MPKKSDYPKDFIPNYPPEKPRMIYDEFIYNHKIIEDLGSFCCDAIIDIDEKCKLSICLDDDDDDDACFSVQKVEIIKIPNPSYHKYLKQYEKKKREYPRKLKEWKILKARWDKEQEEEDRAVELKMLEKLKKKYENAKENN